MARSWGWRESAKTLRGAVAVLATTVLAACGGGGGSTPITYSFELSGSIAIAETAAVDSDTNDVRQSPYAVNDSPSLAQALKTPVLLVGSVNLPGQGPAGTNFQVGDEDDVFIVDLVANQVVELEFASDPAQSDVDLYVYDAGVNEVGRSIGEDTNFECITISRAGRYYVNVSAFSGASIYNLRIGAPGSSGSCATTATKLDFNPDELIAEPRRASKNAATAAAGLLRNAGASLAADVVGTLSALPAAQGPQRVRLPRDASQRMRALQNLSLSQPDSTVRALGQLSKPALERRLLAASEPSPPAILALKLAKRLQASGQFEYVEPNWVAQHHALVGNFPPDDRNYAYQRWHYEQISLPDAMSRITALAAQPAQRPIVAVIDDGVALDHPDLQPQLFSNGRTFVTGSDSASGDNTARSQDQPVFHGTHVAGTVAAQTFDGVGAAGVAPMAQIMPLRVFPAQGGARSDDIIQAMRYAARLSNRSGTLPARRADVINMSLGGDRACDAAYQTAINDVRAAGVIVVVSAGNSGRNDVGQRVAVGSPANCSGAIAVSATDARRRVTYYSNTGSALDVAAPGGDSGQSTTGTGAPDNVYSDIATFDARGVRQPAFGGMMGTSMAAPHVSGVMALMRYVNPNLTVAQVDSLLSNGRLTDAVGASLDFGNGLINARKAVDEALLLASGGTAPSVPLVAQPSAVDMGAFQSSAAIQIGTSGTSSETVTGVTSDAPTNAFVVDESQVNATTGLGTYVFTVDRSRFAGAGTYFPRINFVLSSGRTLTVQFTVQVAAPGTTVSTANMGPMYVLLIDPDTGNVVQTVLASLSNGRYNWSTPTPYTKKTVAIFAGGDLDNDDLICQRGEPCGGYPVLPPGDDLLVVDLSDNGKFTNRAVAGLNFQAAPLSGISPSSLSGSLWGTGWRKTAPSNVLPILDKTR
jgi:serine protease